MRRLNRRRRLLGLLESGGGASYARTITPTYGNELLSDPGLEGTYTDGLCAALTKGGSPTVAESSDVHGGAKAQEFTPVANANSVYVGTLTGGAAGFFRYAVWAKRTAGASGKVLWYVRPQIGAQNFKPAITSSTYVNLEIIFREAALGAFGGLTNTDASVFDTIIIDDLSFKKLSIVSAFATPRTHAADAIVRAAITAPLGYQGGIAMNVNSATAPTYYVLGYVDRNPTDGTAGRTYCTLDQVINNTWTRLIHAAVTYVEGAPVEVRNVDNTYQLWYNGLQVGTDQTISDATLRAGVIAMQFATSPNVIFSDYAA